MTATRYKIGGSVVTLRFGGLFHRELDALGPCAGTDGLSGDDGGCRQVKRRQTLGEDSR